MWILNSLTDIFNSKKKKEIKKMATLASGLFSIIKKNKKAR